VYLHASEQSTRRYPGHGLGGGGGCSPDAVTKGTSCWFDSTSSQSPTAVYVPAAALRSDPVRLLVWIHGDIIPCGDEGKDAISYVKSDIFPLARQLTDSKQPFVLVVPTMKWNWKTNKVRHALGTPKTMNAFLDEVRNGLTRAGWSKAPTIGRLILAGHSRAYVVLNALAAASSDPASSLGALGKLSDLWLIDTTYGKKNKAIHCKNWMDWARTRAKAPFVNLRILYRKDSDTSDVAECIRDEAVKSALSNVTVQGFPSHCSLPRDQLPALLAAGVTTPRAPRSGTSSRT